MAKTQWMLGFLGGLCLTTSAQAAPKALSSDTPAVASASGALAIAARPEWGSPRPTRPTEFKKPSWGGLWASGAAAAFIAAPVSLLLGQWIGTWSNNLYGALIPAALVAMALPPLAVVLVQAHEARFETGFRPSVWRAYLVGLGAQVVMVALAMVLGLNGHGFVGLAALTAADMVILPWATGPLIRAATHPTPPTQAAWIAPVVNVHF